MPHSPERALKAKMSKAEANLKYPSRTKFVEEVGRSLREMMCRAEPDPQHCGRRGYFPCSSAPGACMRQGGLYAITCLECKMEGKTSVYHGETGRTLYDRGLEHQKAHRGRAKENMMVEHEEEEHEQKEVSGCVSGTLLSSVVVLRLSSLTASGVTTWSRA